MIGLQHHFQHKTSGPWAYCDAYSAPLARQVHIATGCVQAVNYGRASVVCRKTHIVCKSTKSIKEFIQTECPVRGLDGTYRERMLQPTMTTALIPLDDDTVLTPGCQTLCRIAEPLLQQVLADQGQVVIGPVQNTTTGLQIVTSAKGSYCCVARVLGFQRLGDQGGFIRVMIDDRAQVQAMMGTDTSNLRVQAAPLQDRWAYFVRATAVQEALDGLPAASTTAREVQAAASNCIGVAEELEEVMNKLHQLLQELSATQGSQSAPTGPTADEMLDEWERIMQWCQEGKATPGTAPSCSTQTAPTASSSVTGAEPAFPFTYVHRLSYAPLAAALAASFSGWSSDALVTARKKAVEASDLGLRLEETLEFAEGLHQRLVARLALDRL